MRKPELPVWNDLRDCDTCSPTVRDIRKGQPPSPRRKPHRDRT